MTNHRRENFGEPQHQVFGAINDLIERFDDIEVIFPVHPNPNIQESISKWLQPSSRLQLLPPLGYFAFTQLLSHCYLVMTDSGGVQEEAPMLGIPAIVMRRATERDEVLLSGNAVLAGTDRKSVYDAAARILSSDEVHTGMARKSFPFGNRGAAVRIAKIIMERVSDTDFAPVTG